MGWISVTVHGAALMVFYSAYGLLQERIYKSGYGPEHERFTTTPLLVLFNRIFSIVVAVIVLLYTRASVSAPLAGRLRPASPFPAYAAVATSNFLATSCQYEALRHVSYTTQSLAKTMKMLPVICVGYLVFKQTHSQKALVSALVIATGAATYLFSAPVRGRHSGAAAGGEEFTSVTDALWGALLLGCYLFFDGLTSTSQERFFGKVKGASKDPFGPESPVMDQMLWTNVFAAIYAAVALVITLPGGALVPALSLLLSSPALVFDMMAMSLVSCLGLLVLLNSIANFGALTTSTIMTVRQFTSILLNAGVYGTFGHTSVVGWLGVGWVASGVYIQVDRSFDEPKKTAPQLPVDADEERFPLVSKTSQNPDEKWELRSPEADNSEPDQVPRWSVTRQKPQYGTLLKRYGIPCFIPLLLALLVPVAQRLPPVNIGHRHRPEQISFMIAGVQKGGTSALFQLLQSDHRLSWADTKEAHFFDEQLLDFTHPEELYASAYESRWPPLKPGEIRGEATPDTFYFPVAMPRMQQYNPDMKIILLFRDPMQRAFSQYNMEVGRQGSSVVESMSFSDAIRGGLNRTWGQPDMYWSYVQRGYYGAQLDRVLALFPREQLLLLRTEDFEADKQQTVNMVTEFIGLPRAPPLPDAMKHDFFVGSYHGHSQLSLEDCLYMQDLYREDLAHFTEISGLDTSTWRCSESAPAATPESPSSPRQASRRHRSRL